jgi:outer membrane protein assembly factor BamB
MRRNRWPLLLSAALAAVSACALVPLAAAGDWPTWGRDGSRNMVSPDERNLPDAVTPGKPNDDTGEVDLSATKGIAWVAKLGSQTYGNPVVAGGRVYVGTNNAKPRDEKYQGDHGVLLCLDERTGKLLWQLAVPKLAAGRNVDWEDCGICSSPAVDGDKVYVVTNRCEVLCLDAAGLANGNQGVADEAQAAAGPGKPPVDQGPQDADVLWRYDLRHELGVFPHFQTASNPLVVGGKLYVTTSNGVDWSDKHVPSPDAPALICLEKTTGKLLGGETAGISGRTLYCNWSAPAYGPVGGRPTVVFGGGDGFLYGFDPGPTPDGHLRELWRVDCNPPEYRVAKDGKPIKYRDGKGLSEIIATPVVWKDKVYVAIGQDPEHGPGAGALNCVAVTYAADQGKAAATAAETATAKVEWRNTTVGRSMSTAAVTDGLLLVPELSGVIHAVDPATGKELWRHDAESNVWGSVLLADGKGYVGNESGELLILSAGAAADKPAADKPAADAKAGTDDKGGEDGKDARVIAKIDLGGSVFSSPVAANGAVYVATGTQLYKLKK